MAATNRYMNSSVTWAPGGTSPAALTGIKSAQYNNGITFLKESADYDLYDTVGGAVHINPTITLRTIDAFALYATVAGATGTLTVTFRDFTNGATASGGAKTVTMTGALLASRNVDAEHRVFTTQNLMFEANSTDGATSPVAVAAL